MKKVMALGSIVVLMGGIALADDAGGGAPYAKRELSPCVKIVNACKAAGFVRGGWKEGKEGKDMIRDCYKPIVANQAVPGVKVDGSLIRSCQQRRASRKKKAT